MSNIEIEKEATKLYSKHLLSGSYKDQRAYINYMIDNGHNMSIKTWNIFCSWWDNLKKPISESEIK